MKHDKNLMEITLKFNDYSTTYTVESDYRDYRGICEAADILYSILEYDGVDEIVLFDEYGDEKYVTLDSSLTLERMIKGVRFLE